MRKIVREIAYFLGYKNSWINKEVDSYRRKKAIMKRRQTGSQKLVIYGCEMLDQLYKAVSDANVHLWLEWGTLLGAYRDKTFIGHDYDCDTGILASEYSLDFENILMKYGFIRKHGVFVVDRETDEETLVELTFAYKDFELDMTFSFVENGKRLMYIPCNPRNEHASGEFEIHVYEHDYPLPTIPVVINGHTYQAPNNPAGVLKNTYGPTFMIPDPNFVTTNQYENVRVLDFCKKYIKVYGTW